MWKFHARAYIGRGQKFVACRTSASLEATVRRAPIRSLPSRGSNIRALNMFGGLTPTAVDLAWIKFTSLSSVVSGLKLPIYRTDLFGPGFCLEIRDHDSSSDGIGSTHIRFSLFSPSLRSDGVMFPSWGFVLFLSCWSRVRTLTFVLVPNNSSWSSSEEAEANVLPFFSPSPSDDFLFFFPRFFARRIRYMSFLDCRLLDHTKSILFTLTKLVSHAIQTCFQLIKLLTLFTYLSFQRHYFGLQALLAISSVDLLHPQVLLQTLHPNSKGCDYA